ncbi:hypothetical protein HUU53_03680 [Candidatus Micrarchaeota archaeon]|nr:hypothetical protein [Candidatus Micrarchaeota archaeon]
MKFLIFVFLLFSPLLLAQSPTPQTCTENGCYCYDIARFFAACLVGEDDFSCPYEACFAKKPTKTDWEDWQEKNKEKYPNCPCLLIPVEYFEENYDPPELEIKPCSLAQQSPDYVDNSMCGGIQESAVCVNGKIEKRVSCADSSDYCSRVFGENSICVQKKILVATGQKDWWNPWDKPDPEVVNACYQCRTIDSCRWEKQALTQTAARSMIALVSVVMARCLALLSLKENLFLVIAGLQLLPLPLQDRFIQYVLLQLIMALAF